MKKDTVVMYLLPVWFTILMAALAAVGVVGILDVLVFHGSIGVWLATMIGR